MSSSSSIQSLPPSPPPSRPPSPPPQAPPPSYNAYKVGDIVNARHGEGCRENYEAKILRIHPSTETVRVRWSINGLSEDISMQLIQSHSIIDFNGGRPTRRKRRPDWFDSKNRNNLTAAEVASVCLKNEGEDNEEGGEEDFSFKADMNMRGAEKEYSSTSMNYAESEDDELDMVPKRKKKRSPRRRRSIFSNSSSNNSRVNSKSKKKRRGNKRITLKRRGVAKVKQPVVSQNYSDGDESEHPAEEKEEEQLENYNNGIDDGSKNGSDQYISVAFASASIDNIEDYIERTFENEGDVPLSECSITNKNRDEDGGENHGDESLSMSDNDNCYYNNNENELETWVGNILYSNNADEDQFQTQTGADDPISIDVDSGGDGISGAGVMNCDKDNKGNNEAFVDRCSEVEVEVEVEPSCKHVDIEYLRSNQESERSGSFLDEDIQIKIKSATKDKVTNSTVPLVEPSIRESLRESLEDDDCIDDDTSATSSSNSIQTQEDYPSNGKENDTISDNAELSDEEETLDGGMSYVDDENSIKTQADTDELDLDLDRSQSIHVQDDEDSLNCNMLELMKKQKKASNENHTIEIKNKSHSSSKTTTSFADPPNFNVDEGVASKSHHIVKENGQQIFDSNEKNGMNKPTIVNANNETIESSYAFCCYKCNCPEEKIQKYQDNPHVSCGNSGNNNIVHRTCCHPDRDINEEWDSPIMEALKKEVTTKNKSEQYISRYDLEKKVAQLRKEEVTEMNRNSLEATDQLLYTSEKYLNYCKYHRNLCNDIEDKRKDRLGPIVVLDVFSGIGSAIVALKKLRIAISTVISVEHDPVARWVSRYNHDKAYNDCLKEEEKDSIRYVYDYTTFEDLEENITDVINKFGPIDLVVGGPPCSDYSQINAFRKGASGESGKYLVRFGELIKKIQSLQMNKHVFFLSENVVADKTEMHKMESVYGLPHVQLDARDYSPCKRKRIYWINFPLSALAEDDPRKDSVPELENGVMASLCFLKDSNMVVKANTFLASEGRLDDIPRMLIVKRENQNGVERYTMQTFSVQDREVMMGFPCGYVHEALRHLYSTLKRDAFAVEFESGASWHNRLDEKFHHFCNCDFKFEPCDTTTCTDSESLPFEIKIGTQREHRQDGYYLNCEKYSKRLLGNAWSIPVVEELLSSLQQICVERKYDDYEYVFPWPPHNLV